MVIWPSNAIPQSLATCKGYIGNTQYTSPLLIIVQYWFIALGSAVAVELIFSGGHDTISLHHASLRLDTIHTLMLIKQRLRLARTDVQELLGDLAGWHCNAFIVYSYIPYILFNSGEYACPILFVFHILFWWYSNRLSHGCLSPVLYTVMADSPSGALRMLMNQRRSWTREHPAQRQR